MVGQNQLRAWHAPVGPPGGATLHVDELRPERHRLIQQMPARVFIAIEHAALPDRPARDNHRPRPSLQRAGDIHVTHAVQTEFDQVGAARLLSTLAQRRHVAGGHGMHYPSRWHNKKGLFSE